MPMTETYATAGACRSVHQLAIDAAAVVRGLERVPNVASSRKPVAGEDSMLPDRTWMILTAAIAGSCELKHRAHCNYALLGAACAELPKLKT
jgi:hypothetical protein